MSENQIFNVLKPTDYIGKDKKAKTHFQVIATAFPIKDGQGLRFELPEGLSISGKVVIMPRDAQTSGDELDDPIPL